MTLYLNTPAREGQFVVGAIVTVGDSYRPMRVVWISDDRRADRVEPRAD